MTTNILFVGERLTRNLGGPSLLVGTMKALRRFFPNASFTMLSPLGDDPLEQAAGATYGLTVYPSRKVAGRVLLLAPLARLLKRPLGSRSTRNLLRALMDADVIVNIDGLSFADALAPRTLHAWVAKLRFFVLGKMLRKPVVKYTASLGPFRDRWNRAAAKFCFGRCCDLIMAREQDSLEEMATLGVHTKTVLCPDSGFLLSASECALSRDLASSRQAHPVIGLSVSHQTRRTAASPSSYLDAMAHLVRHAVEQYSAGVVVIPNAISENPAVDDRAVAREVQIRAGADLCEIVPAEALRPEELKGVIGACDIVVAARYHTIVAALTLAVPVLAIGWHHKYRGVMDLFGQGRHLCDVADCSATRIIEMFDDLWAARLEAHELILSHVPAVVESIYQGAGHVRDLLLARGMARASKPATSKGSSRA